MQYLFLQLIVLYYPLTGTKKKQQIRPSLKNSLFALSMKKNFFIQVFQSLHYVYMQVWLLKLTTKHAGIVIKALLTSNIHHC